MPYPFQPFDVSDSVQVSLSTQEIVDWSVHAIHADDVWKRTRGAGIKVAVLDTGCQADHPDLAANVSLCTGSDEHGHGTHVAGAIAAADNGVGVVGVAPEASLYLYKVVPGSADSIASAVRQAVTAGVDIINMSLGAYDDIQDLHDALITAYDAGIILVAAAGNDPNRVSYPAMYPEVIAVSALDKNGQRASFAPMCPNHVALPGVDCLSTWIGSQWAHMSGTSSAAPLLSGTLALCLASQSVAREDRHAFVAQEMARIDAKCGDFFYEPNLDLL